MSSRGDDGAGTVFAIMLVAVVVLVGLALAGLGASVVARTRAQSAADLAALAAGDVLGVHHALDPAAPGGGEIACTRARDVAARNGALVVSCATEPGAVVVVRVSRSTPFGAARASARAGPRS